MKQGKVAEHHDGDDSSFDAEPPPPFHPSGELRSFAKDIGSRASMLNLRGEKAKEEEDVS